MREKVTRSVKKLCLVKLFVIGISVCMTSVDAASVVKKTTAYTLYSDGKLEIRSMQRIFATQWDSTLHDDIPVCRELFEKTLVGGEIFYINSNVREIVILEENCKGSGNWLLDRFPNTQSITVLKPDESAMFYMNIVKHGVEPTTDHYNEIKGIVDEWNSRYRNKLILEKTEPVDSLSYSYEYSAFFSKKICVISYDVGFVKERVLSAGCRFQALTCKLDKLSSIVANDSIFYDGKSHAADIEKKMHIRCVNDHGTESYLSHKILTKETNYKVSYYNKTTGKNNDTANAGTIKVTVNGINGHNGTLTGYYTIKPQALKKNNVSLSKTNYTYSGKIIKPKIAVKNTLGKTLKEGTDYTVSYSNNKNAGTALITVKGKGNYTGTIKKTFKIAKAKQTISLKVSKKEYKQNALKKKNVEFSIGASAKTKLSYQSSAKKYITVTSKGKVTVKKGTPKGKYKITVTAIAGKNYVAAKRTVSINVK